MTLLDVAVAFYYNSFTEFAAEGKRFFFEISVLWRHKLIVPVSLPEFEIYATRAFIDFVR